MATHPIIDTRLHADALSLGHDAACDPREGCEGLIAELLISDSHPETWANRFRTPLVRFISPEGEVEIPLCILREVVELTAHRRAA